MAAAVKNAIAADCLRLKVRELAEISNVNLIEVVVVDHKQNKECRIAVRSDRDKKQKNVRIQ